MHWIICLHTFFVCLQYYFSLFLICLFYLFVLNFLNHLFPFFLFLCRLFWTCTFCWALFYFYLLNFSVLFIFLLKFLEPHLRVSYSIQLLLTTECTLIVWTPCSFWDFILEFIYYIGFIIIKQKTNELELLNYCMFSLHFSFLLDLLSCVQFLLLSLPSILL